MDLSAVVNTEALYTLELKHPATEEPFGVMFDIRSASSPEAKAVQRKILDKRLERQQRAKLIKADQAINAEIEQLAACVAGWEWGEHTFGGETLEYSLKNVCKVLETDWIFAQVHEAANTIGNFTQS